MYTGSLFYHRWQFVTLLAWCLATMFGWIVSGCVSSCQVWITVYLISYCVCIEKEQVNVNPVWQEFEKSVYMVDGHYEVALPWRPGAASRLQKNVRSAATRLRHLDKHLAQNLELKVLYDTVIHTNVGCWVMEEVSVEDLKCDGPVFYMSHRPIIRETVVSSKVRSFLMHHQGLQWSVIKWLYGGGSLYAE